MNRSIASFEELIDRYADYLSGKGIQFNPQGFPMLQPQMYLDEWPELMVPYRDRKARFVHNPSHTVLCLFTSDMDIPATGEGPRRHPGILAVYGCRWLGPHRHFGHGPGMAAGNHAA